MYVLIHGCFLIHVCIFLLCHGCFITIRAYIIPFLYDYYLLCCFFYWIYLWPTPNPKGVLSEIWSRPILDCVKDTVAPLQYCS